MNMGDEKMFKDKSDKTCADEDEFFYNVMMTQAFNIHSPFEVGKDIDFPKKDELGGVVLKFIGGGAAYFKIQTEMPTKEEVMSIYEVGLFLQESFGDYVVLTVLCTPDIEIRDIEVLENDNFSTDFLSIRKNDAIEVMDSLTDKLKNNRDFTIDDHIQRVFLPFMGRKSEEEFERRYREFLDLFAESDIEPPAVSDLLNARCAYKRWYSDDSVYDYSIFRNKHLPF
jgi:hypothetical protein